MFAKNIVFFIFLFTISLSSAGCSKGEVTPTKVPPPPVVLQKLHRQDVPITYTFPGQLTGVHSVDVVARAEGVLLKQYYKNGAKVQQNESLFLIDPSVSRASLKEKESQLRSAQATYDYARDEYNRINELYQKNAYSTSQYQQALSQFKNAEAQLKSIQQSVEIARINLSYTKVEASVNGVVQQPEVNIGTLVKPGTVLTKIASVDSLYVNFALPVKQHHLILAQIKRGIFVLDPAGYTVRIEKKYGVQGAIAAKVDSIGTDVNTQTDSVSWRAIASNQEGLFLPGEFVTVDLHGIIAKDALFVPQKAIIYQGQNAFVWVVDSNNIAQLRKITLGDTVNSSVLVLDGLNDGESIIVEGILKARAGAPVTPTSPSALSPATK